MRLMINPKDLYEKAMESAEDYADKDYASGLLDDAVEALEGVITAELKAEGQPTTLIPKLIKKDKRLMKEKENRRGARKQAIIAKLKYEQVNRYQDNLRTNEVTVRKLT